MKKKTSCLLAFSALCTLSACSLSNKTQTTDSTEQTVSGATVSVLSASASEMFTDNDLKTEYDEANSAKITLAQDQSSSDSNAVQISGNTITISDEGTYILSGSLADGMIIVNAEDTDKVRIVLNEVYITSSTSAAIYVQEADKVFITSANGTNNTLSNGGQYVAIDENNIDAVVFSKADLTLNGAGTLTIQASAGHGVVSKDDLVLTSGTYEISAASHGLSGKDSVRIASGTYTINSGKDGIHAENTEDTSVGFMYIAGGTFTINAQQDGMSSSANLDIEDGTFTITTGEGSASVSMTTNSMGFGMQGGFNEQAQQTTTQEDEISQKGIKSTGTLTLLNGTFVTDTVDDSIHSNSDIVISNGVFDLKSGDDAIHADSGVHLQNGTYTISYCYEGIEGVSVTIDEGTYNITAVDDGINAGGGIDSSGFGAGNFAADQFSEQSSSSITINGGNYTIVSNGDCVDSNGALTINGGVLNLTCNGNGNTALDCDGTYANNGGEVTTNDGSESIPGQMGGGQGGNMNPGHMDGPNMTDPNMGQDPAAMEQNPTV